MNVAARRASRFAHGAGIITFTVSLYACAAQPTESQMQSRTEIDISAEDAEQVPIRKVSGGEGAPRDSRDPRSPAGVGVEYSRLNINRQ